MSSGKHAGNSFANLVAQESSKQAREIIAPMVQQEVLTLVSRLGANLEKGLNRYLSQALSKLSVIEKLLIEKGTISAEEIGTAVMTHEDAAWGLEAASDATKENDTVRLVVRKKAQAEGSEYSLPFNVIVPATGSGQSELGKTLEAALVGLSTGDKKEVQDDEGKTTLEVTVTRISRKKEVPNVQQS